MGFSTWHHDILDLIILSWIGLSVHCREVRNMTGLCPLKATELAAKLWQLTPSPNKPVFPRADMDRAETHCQRLTVAEENINGLHLQKVIVQIRKQRLRLLRGLPAPHPIPFQHKMAMHLVPSSPFYSWESGCLSGWKKRPPAQPKWSWRCPSPLY